MNAHVRIGDNRIFSLKQAVLLYQEGSRAFATLHEVKCRRHEAPYLCAGQSVTMGFLETLAAGQLIANVCCEMIVVGSIYEFQQRGARVARLGCEGTGYSATRLPFLRFGLRGRSCGHHAEQCVAVS